MISNSFKFFESLKIVLTNIVAILMISAKLVTLGPLQLKYFEIKVIIFIQGITNKILSRDPNCCKCSHVIKVDQSLTLVF